MLKLFIHPYSFVPQIISFIFFSTLGLHSKVSHSQDAKAASAMSAVMGGMMVATSVRDLGTSGPACGTGSAWDCVNATLSVGVIIGGAYSIITSLTSKDSTTGSNGPGFTPPPGGGPGGGPNGPVGNPFDGSNFCGGDPSCSCTTPEAAANPLCSPDPRKSLGDLAAQAKAIIADNPGLDFGNGVSADSLLKDLDNNLRAFENAFGVATGEIDPSALEGSGFGNFSKDGKAGSGSKGGYSEDAVDGASGGGGGSGGVGSTVGPKDRSGLGKTVWNGLLDMLDDATGKSLTLWQRATRRYQGERGQRALLMARMEMIRNRGRKLAMERQSALKSKSVVKAAKKKSLSAKTKNPSAPKNQKAKSISKSSAQSAPLK